MKQAIEFSKELIRIPSVTPDAGKVLDYMQSVLTPAGFACTRKVFSEEGTPNVDNLFARWGTGAPHIMFAGHVDVVPVGDESKWHTDPFEPTEKDGKLYGRGAEDMKGAIGCFMAAALDKIETPPHTPPASGGGLGGGSISFLITCDEEGPAINGSRKCVPWLKEIDQVPDACIVGEPTNPTYIGEMVKIGRRGSLYWQIDITGKQGHVAYPDLADNPITMLTRILTDIKAKPIDEGSEHFLPTGIEITEVTTAPGAKNVIPEWARAKISIRYNTLHTFDSIKAWLEGICDAHAKDKWQLTPHHSGEPFLTPEGPLSELMVRAIEKVTGHTPDLSTTGGTSDARFIKDICPVVEFGTTGFTPHMVNECVKIADLELLAACYREILEGYFA